MTDLKFCFQYLKGRCHGNQFCLVPDLFARSQSISGYTVLIFTIFSPYESALSADDIPVLVYQFIEGRCHGNQLFWGKYHERRLIPLAFFALLLKKSCNITI